MIVVTTSNEVDLYVREVIVKQGTGVIVTPGEYNQVANCFFQATVAVGNTGLRVP